MSFGENLRRIRKEQQRTQSDVAQAVGVMQTHISNMENGSSQPSVDVAVRIADCLSVSLDDLFRTPASPVAELEPVQP